MFPCWAQYPATRGNFTQVTNLVLLRFRSTRMTSRPSDFPSNVFTFTGNATYDIYTGSDWAGVVLNNTNAGGTLYDSLAHIAKMDTDFVLSVQRSWFLRDGESGLHSFLRLAYYNSSQVSIGSLGESRTMFRPNGGPWTHLVTNSEQWVRVRVLRLFQLFHNVGDQAPIPSAEALAQEVQVQDAYVWRFNLLLGLML